MDFSTFQSIYDLMHILPIWLKSEEASVYNVNDDILFFRFHLVIGRQAQSTPENIGSYVDSRAFYVGICASASVSLDSYEGMRPIYRLHMHGLSRW